MIRIEKNGVVQFHKDYQESGSQHATDRSLLTVEQIIAFANEVDIADVQETLQRQIDYNWAIAERACAEITARTSAVFCCSLTA